MSTLLYPAHTCPLLLPVSLPPRLASIIALAASIFLAVSPDLMICTTISLQSRQTVITEPWFLDSDPLGLLSDPVLLSWLLSPGLVVVALGVGGRGWH